MLVENVHDPDASVNGCFVFQRKGPKEKWEDYPAEPLSGFKKGEAYKLELSSEEVKKLCGELALLYELHGSQGIPYGTARYVKASATVTTLRKCQMRISTLSLKAIVCWVPRR